MSIEVNLFVVNRHMAIRNTRILQAMRITYGYTPCNMYDVHVFENYSEREIKVCKQIDLMVCVQAQPGDFDAVLLPGGASNADFLRMNPKAQDFVRQLDSSGKPMAIICHAPWLLVSAGLVKGRKLTSYYTIQDDIRNAGGNWVDQEMVRDRNWVTSRSPKDLGAFNPAMVSLFAESKTKAPQL
jgi:PfpI family intracellular protease